MTFYASNFLGGNNMFHYTIGNTNGIYVVLKKHIYKYRSAFKQERNLM